MSENASLESIWKMWAAQTPAKTQISIRIDEFIKDLSSRLARTEGGSYQDILRQWTERGALEWLKDTVDTRWYFNLLENGKIHAGIENQKLIRYYREEEKGKLTAIKAYFEIWFSSDHLGYLHAVGARLLDVANEVREVLEHSKSASSPFFWVTCQPMVTLVEVRGNLMHDGKGLAAMKEALSCFCRRPIDFLTRVIEQGNLVTKEGEDDLAKKQAQALQKLSARQAELGKEIPSGLQGKVAKRSHG